MRRLLTALSTSVVLVFQIASAQSGNVCDSAQRAKQSRQLNETDQALIHALSDKKATAEALSRQLDAASAVTEKGQQLSPYLHDLALVQISVLDIREQRYAKARSQLMQIPLQSDQTIQAGLMIAESYRLEGNSRQAVSWFLRMGKNFPTEASALSGLLSAGKELEQQGQLDSAHGLYGLVMRDALKAAVTVNKLQAAHRNDPSAFLLHRSDTEDTHLKRQLVRSTVMASGGSFMAMDRTARTATRQEQCLLARSAEFNSRRERLEQATRYADENLDILIDTLAQQELELERLTRQVEPGNFSDFQIGVRTQVTALRQDIQRNQVTRQILEQNRAAIPTIAARLDKEIQSLTAQMNGVSEKANQQLVASFDQACDKLEGVFRDLSGEAAFRRAEVELAKAIQAEQGQ